jgi:hypothetical protein
MRIAAHLRRDLRSYGGQPCERSSYRAGREVQTMREMRREYQVTAKRLVYGYDKRGDVVLPFEPPFDGGNYLIKTKCGWVEAWWDSSRRIETLDGPEWEGFSFVCCDDKFQAGLGEVEFWTELPEIK